MDETPEELEEIQREAAKIDVYRYRRRRRLIISSLVTLAGAGVCWLAVTMSRASRNPCERVRDYFCKTAPDQARCVSYRSIMGESIHDPSPAMRSMIRDQCLTKITRMKEEDSITVP
jgi:hypothetical protein